MSIPHLVRIKYKTDMNIEDKIPDLVWTKELNCGITVCDGFGNIIYMNEKAIQLKHGDLTGKNIFECHNPNSCRIIRHLLEKGGQHIYTIEKDGIHKLLYQSAWKEKGIIQGLCEIMVELSEPIPHFIR